MYTKNINMQKYTKKNTTKNTKIQIYTKKIHKYKNTQKYKNIQQIYQNTTNTTKKNYYKNIKILQNTT